MSEKSELISKLKTDKEMRRSYLRAKLNVLIPSQIRALRLKAPLKQGELATEANMLQPRISAMERPGATKFNLETLIRLAAAFRVGLVVKFVPFSEMLRWQNDFSQDEFDVTAIDNDLDFQREDDEEEAAAEVADSALAAATLGGAGQERRASQSVSDDMERVARRSESNPFLRRPSNIERAINADRSFALPAQ